VPEVKDALEQVCKLLPDTYSDECQEFVDGYLPLIWALLQSEFNNDEICKQLGLCPSAKTAAKPRAEPKQDLCQYCELVVSFLQPFLNNSTENEVKDALEQVCKLLPDTYSDECQEFVDGYLPLIWALLQSEFNNDEICKQLGLCPSAKTVAKPRAEPKQDLCQYCELVVSFLQPFVDSSQTENEVEDALNQLCELLPESFSDECSQMLKEYFPMIWELMKSELDNDEICIQLGLCPSAKVPATPRTEPKADLCDICKLVVTFLKPFVDSSSTENEVEDALNQLCELLPESFSDKCSQVLKEYFPMIWELMKSELDNDEICIQLGLCPSAKVPATPRTEPKADLCEICKLVVTVMKPFVDSNATEDEVEAAVEEACGLLPGDVGQECDGLVKEFFPVIWDMLKSEVDDDQICSLLGFCSTAKGVTVNKPKAPKGDTECDVCKLVVKILTPFINSNTTEADVKSAVERVCSLIPGSYGQQCEDFVKEYFDLVWTIAKQEVDTGDACELLEFCKSSVSAVSKAATRLVSVKKQDVEKPEGVFCDICELVMEKLESMLVNNATEAEIIAEVEKVCDLFKGTEKDLCELFIDKYGKEIINALVGGAGARMICTLLGLCLGETAPQTTTFAFDMRPREEIDGCEICELVVNLIKQAAGANSSEAEVQAILDKICDLFPDTLKEECTAFVNEYGPQIIQLIVKNIDAKTICGDIDLCPKSASAISAPWRMLERSLLSRG
jgi:saposin